MTRITQTHWLALAERADYRVGRFARRLGVSPRQLERVFQAHGCLPPQAFLDELRLWVAAGWLETGAAPKEVALELHYRSVSWFYHQFGRHHGCTPREFMRIQRRRETIHAARLAELGLQALPPLPDPATEAQGKLVRSLIYLLNREPCR